MRFAAIDTGSNSIKLLVCDSNGAEPLRQICFRYAVSGLSKNMTKDNLLLAENINNTAAIISSYIRECQTLRVDELRITATAWARKAANAPILLDKIAAFGCAPEVISGEEEARLTWLAVAGSFPDEQLLVFNIGGGSTEFILGKDNAIFFKTSLPVGAGQLSAEYLSTTDNIIAPEYAGMKKSVRELLSKHITTQTGGTSFRLVLSGGSGTNIAQVATGRELDWNNIASFPISFTQLSKVEQLLTETSLAARKLLPGIHADRADVLPAGAAITTTLMQLIAAKNLYITSNSLSHGIITDMFNIHFYQK